MNLTYTDSLARASSQSIFLPTIPQAQSKRSQGDSWFTPATQKANQDGIGLFMDRDSFEYTYQSQLIVEKLLQIRGEINEMLRKGDKEGRDEAIDYFSTTANNEV